MINTHKLELPLSRTYFHGSKCVLATEALLYFNHVQFDLFHVSFEVNLFQNISLSHFCWIQLTSLPTGINIILHIARSQMHTAPVCRPNFVRDTLRETARDK